MEREPERNGLALLAGVSAFVIWGLVPGYWKLLARVPAAQILAHRCLWTIVFLAALLSWTKRWPEVLGHFRSRRSALFCLASGVMISANWFLFIWSVNIGRVLETSLGYFLTPIVNVLLGGLILRERLSRLQLISISIASGGILLRTFAYGRFPVIAVLICLTFGCYGLLRKKSGTGPIPGLFLETAFLLPLAVFYLAFSAARGDLVFGPRAPALSGILLTTGVVTALPLVWFGYAARHLRLISLGFLQYLSPSLSFLLAAFVFHEPFSQAQLLTFILIWVALGLVSLEGVWRWRVGNRASPLESAEALELNV